jgi:hypothetical protein
MKRFYLSVAVALLSFISLNAQTSSQKSLINDFFKRRDVQEIIQQAHPTCTHHGVTVSRISGNSIYLTADYEDWADRFDCQYRLDVDNDGVFLSLNLVDCGNLHTSTGIIECFDALNISKLANYLDEKGEPLVSNHPAVKIQERVKGKVLDRFYARELICCALFRVWYDDDYYVNY